MLLSLALDLRLRSLSMIGMAKNAGKTVAFNHLIHEAAGQGLALGLTSIGRDGESTDAVFRVPKPRIFAHQGSVIATARGSLRNCSAKLKVAAATGFMTAIGEVLICQVISSGYVELAGAAFRAQQRAVIDSLFLHGADLVLVDGALDRVAGAAPSLTQGTILSTGAALAAGMADVLDKTKDRIERLLLPQTDPEIAAVCSRMGEEAKAAVITGQKNLQIIDSAGSLTAGEAIARLAGNDAQTVVLKGAAGDMVLAALTPLAARNGGLRLVIKDGANFFADRRIWQKFVHAGGRVEVLDPISLVAVTVNPFSPVGPSFDPEAFLQAAGAAFHPLPVADVVRGRYKVSLDSGEF